MYMYIQAYVYKRVSEEDVGTGQTINLRTSQINSALVRADDWRSQMRIGSLSMWEDNGFTFQMSICD